MARSHVHAFNVFTFAKRLSREYVQPSPPTTPQSLSASFSAIWVDQDMNAVTSHRPPLHEPHIQHSLQLSNPSVYPRHLTPLLRPVAFKREYTPTTESTFRTNSPFSTLRSTATKDKQGSAIYFHRTRPHFLFCLVFIWTSRIPFRRTLSNFALCFLPCIMLH